MQLTVLGGLRNEYRSNLKNGPARIWVVHYRLIRKTKRRPEIYTAYVRYHDLPRAELLPRCRWGRGCRDSIPSCLISITSRVGTRKKSLEAVHSPNFGLTNPSSESGLTFLWTILRFGGPTLLRCINTFCTCVKCLWL